MEKIEQIFFMRHQKFGLAMKNRDWLCYVGVNESSLKHC